MSSETHCLPVLLVTRTAKRAPKEEGGILPLKGEEVFFSSRGRRHLSPEGGGGILLLEGEFFSWRGSSSKGEGWRRAGWGVAGNVFV